MRDENLTKHLYIPGEFRRTIVLGDIHGCFDELRTLLGEVQFCPNDLLISVGDLVDRGPRPLEVVRFFRGTPNAFVCLGNHERRVAGAIRGTVNPAWTQQHTLSKIPENQHASVADYFESLPAVIETDQLIATHARLDPSLGIREQDPYHTAGVGGPSVVIDMDAAGVPTWFNEWRQQHADNKAICFGHLCMNRIALVPGELYALDSGAASGGRLSALVWPDAVIVSVEATANHSIHSRNEWKTAVFLSKPVEDLPIHVLLTTEQKDEMDKVDTELVRRFREALDARNYVHQGERILQRLLKHFGALPEPGPKRGDYFMNLRRGLDPELSRLVKWLFAKDPSERKLLSAFAGISIADLDTLFGDLQNWASGSNH